MYPVLILREEAVCLIILILLALAAGVYNVDQENKAFKRLISFAVLHVLFDVITVLTVNHQAAVPSIVNYVCHSIFYLAAILYANEMFCYVFKQCHPEFAKKSYLISLIPPAVYVLGLPFMEIRYQTIGGTALSLGSAVYIAFAMAFIYLMASIALILANWRKLNNSVKHSILPMLVILILSEVLQYLVPQVLFTGAAMTIVTVGFYFSVENPIHVFERKAMTDALTGVHSRHSYELEMGKIEKKYQPDSGDEYMFVFCDINNLRAVNGRFGHHEGDHYITLVATALLKNLRKARNIYRMGGDEFLAIYYKTPEESVMKELEAVRLECEEAAKSMDYTPAVAMGYAMTGPDCRNVRDALRSADYMMYRNKAELKRMNSFITGNSGTRLNLTGLTDRVFEAMCSSNERTYPFIINMETGVTRVSPSWMEYFGLDNDFILNFDETWAEKIHPDDRNMFRDDFHAAYEGRRKYHNCEYRAMNKEGVYVTCTCHGAMYHGRDGSPDIFAGYLVNHGVEEKVDNITGLRRLNVMGELVTKLNRAGASAICMKIVINNFKRINMLYSFEAGNEILKKFGDLCRETVAEYGEVFRQSGSDFSILLPGQPREKAEEIYEKIRQTAMSGIVLGQVAVPLTVYGGAYQMEAGVREECSDIWRSIQLALEDSSYANGAELVFSDRSKAPGEQEGNLLAMIHRDALGERKYFTLRYQPIVGTQSGAMVGAEALLRWVNPQYGEILPNQFIEFLESDPCYFELGKYILRTAVADAMKVKAHIPDFRISVNITALQLQHEEFIPSVMEILNEAGFPAQDLTLELTERCKVLNVEFLKSRIILLRELGIRIALDDMGTGYSTIGLLLTLPFDEIKMDHDFVVALQENPQYRLFAEAIIHGAETMNYSICFEGVETLELLELVRGFGTSFTQGFYLSRPTFPADLLAMAEKVTIDAN